MKKRKQVIYGAVTALILATAIWFLAQGHAAILKTTNTNIKKVTMYKNPGCQCCDKWAGYLENNGFEVTIKETDKPEAVKVQYDIPLKLEACHTAIVEGYVVEGHVPVVDIKRLLRERPPAKGIAVPKMPVGSPGMEGAYSEPYSVYLFGGKENLSVYARH